MCQSGIFGGWHVLNSLSWSKGLCRYVLNQGSCDGENILDCTREPYIITRVLLGRRQETRKERGCHVAGFKDRGRGHESRNVGSLQKLEKARKCWAPREPPKGISVVLSHEHTHSSEVPWKLPDWEEAQTTPDPESTRRGSNAQPVPSYSSPNHHCVRNSKPEAPTRLPQIPESLKPRERIKGTLF